VVTLRALRAACCVSLLAAACSDDFTPRSVLADLRVLAIEASPLEAGPGERVTLRAVRLPPPGVADRRIAEHWTFCPFSVGATVGFACAVPSCEVSLDGTGGGEPAGSQSAVADLGAIGASVTADPGALAQQCLARLSAQGALPPEVPAELPAKVDAVFRYTATASDGSTREAVQLVPFYPAGVPSPRNAAPVVREVDIGGSAVRPGESGPALAQGASLEVRVQIDPASAQTYVDDTGVTLQETLVVSFFTTAGRFDFDRANGPDARVKLKYDQIGPGDNEALVWVVATDLRGGETVHGPFHVPIVH
jgi:hypothetical protein